MQIAAPQFALILLSDRAGDLLFTSQTVLPLVPLIYAGTIFALACRGRATRLRAGHIFVASVLTAVLLGPFRPFEAGRPSSGYLAAQRHAVSLVPATAALSATNRLGAHLATRRHLYVFPVLKSATWITVDATDTYLPDVAFLRDRSGIGVGAHDLYSSPDLMRQVLARLNRSAVWDRVYESHGISVFTRRPTR